MTDRPRMQSTPFTPATSLTQPVALRLFYIEWRLLGEGPRSEHRDQMQLNDLAIAVQCAISDRRLTVISEPALQVLGNGDAPRVHERARFRPPPNLALPTLCVPLGAADHFAVPLLTAAGIPAQKDPNPVAPIRELLNAHETSLRCPAVRCVFLDPPLKSGA